MKIMGSRLRKKVRSAKVKHLGKHPVYVTMTDKFMSGWGKAQGRTAKYVAVAKNYDEAQTVARNARARGDQKNVSIRSTKPKYDTRNVKVGWMNKKSSKRWYERGGF